MITFTWRGYAHRSGREEMHYTIELSEKRFRRLWERFQAWKGSQKDFYLRFVNPLKIKEHGK